MIRLLVLSAFILLSLTPFLTPAVSAQHHGAPPPAATLGDRKILLNIDTQPSPVITGQNAEMKINFVDEKAKKNINHITFRMDISKDGKHVLSEFFHSHEGKFRLSFKNAGGSTSPTYSVGATSDILTNAWIADPGSPIIIRGGEIFSQPGTYKAIFEITTMDNDKTDLAHPIRYEIDIPVS
jgi:hypothetical protein